MSFKLALDVGYFDPGSGNVTRPLDALSVQQVLVQAGGQLPEDVWSAEKLQRHQARMAGQRRLIGFIGVEQVYLLTLGFAWLALGNGPNPAALAFLRTMVAEGCTIWAEDGEATQSILEQFAVTEARWAALKKA